MKALTLTVTLDLDFAFLFVILTSFGHSYFIWKTGDQNGFISKGCCSVSAYQDERDAVLVSGDANREVLLLSHAMESAKPGRLFGGQSRHVEDVDTAAGGRELDPNGLGRGVAAPGGAATGSSDGGVDDVYVANRVLQSQAHLL